jgi:hypothetical protein
VIISAPSDDADAMIVLGVNEEIYKPESHKTVSMASCTTNCLAPVAKVLHQSFGVAFIMFTTIHAYTSSQSLMDMPTRHRRLAGGVGETAPARDPAGYAAHCPWCWFSVTQRIFRIGNCWGVLSQAVQEKLLAPVDTLLLRLETGEMEAFVDQKSASDLSDAHNLVQLTCKQLL